MMKTPNKQTDTVSRKNGVDEAAAIRKMSFVSVAGNTVLSAFKFFAGVTGNSSAMISDSIHSFSDVITTVIAWIGVKASKKEADSAHPYGHERVECIASLLLGIILLATGLGVGKVGVEHIVSGSYETLAVPSMIALVAAAVSIVSKEAMYWYTRYYAKLIHSSAFLADAWHHRSDAFSSIGSLIGIGGAMLGFPVMDSVASVVICLFIEKAALDVFRDAVDKMVDKSCDILTVERMYRTIAQEPGVLAVDAVRTRRFGSRAYVDVEIAAKADMPLREAHQIAQNVHDVIEKNFKEVKHCMVHVNPYPDQEEEVHGNQDYKSSGPGYTEDFGAYGDSSDETGT